MPNAEKRGDYKKIRTRLDSIAREQMKKMWTHNDSTEIQDRGAGRQAGIRNAASVWGQQQQQQNNCLVNNTVRTCDAGGVTRNSRQDHLIVVNLLNSREAVSI